MVVFAGGGGGVQKQKAWPPYLFSSLDLLDEGLAVSTVAISSPLRGVHLILVVPAYIQAVLRIRDTVLFRHLDSGSGMENNLDSGSRMKSRIIFLIAW